MIPRYQRQVMRQLWSLENQYATWLEVELAVASAQAELGLIPADAPSAVAEKAAINVERIAAIEEEVRHDVIAFVTSIEELAGPPARYFHYGLTSSDVLDTALALRLVRAIDIILEDLEALLEAIKRRAFEFKNTLTIGRSHGIHAEPTTFGLKLAIFYDEFQRHKVRLLAARKTIAVGQCSGPVGNFSAPGISPDVEARAMASLGLKPAPVSSQIIQRDRHAEYFTALSLLASSMEKMAVEIRHLARTEVGEVEEPFGKGQKGSSAMPHKKNPIGAENISGLARVVRANSLAAQEDVALWHERDISHSSVERIIGPDSTSLTDYMLVRLTGLIDGLVVHPDRMARNLALTGGLYNSQELLLTLCDKGLSRVEAYRLIQRNALNAHSEGLDFKTLLLEDQEVAAVLTPADIENVFSTGRFAASVDQIFTRVFQADGSDSNYGIFP
ncbi:adenylosuccinate lyase [Deltaproteobacteria bacterium Smac51]|nr:adenylosuccinate lyase [Deltaproteobacteria bacterium Smac51]